jgi:hypothetical protein
MNYTFNKFKVMFLMKFIIIAALFVLLINFGTMGKHACGTSVLVPCLYEF